MEYFADIVASGLIRHDQAAHAIDILTSLDSPEPIGVAIQVGSLGDGMALWRLRIDGTRIPGLRVIVDRRFVPEDGYGNDSRQEGPFVSNVRPDMALRDASPASNGGPRRPSRSKRTKNKG